MVVILPDREKEGKGGVCGMWRWERGCVGVFRRWLWCGWWEWRKGWGMKREFVWGEIMRYFEREREEGWGGCGEIEETHSSKIG